VTKVKDLKDKILHEAHESTYSIYLGGNKMYHDHEATYWWYRIKRDVAEYVALCDTCQSQNQASMTYWIVVTLANT
jgi:hypothetical protein